MSTDTTDTTSTDEAIDFDGVILLPAMCRLLKTGHEAIRQRVKEGSFPVPPIRNVDHRLRWWGPAVKKWLDENSSRVDEGGTDDTARGVR